MRFSCSEGTTGGEDGGGPCERYTDESVADKGDNLVFLDSENARARVVPICFLSSATRLDENYDGIQGGPITFSY